MSSVLHFRRQLDGPPVAVELQDICVRNMKVPDDVAGWLALRDRAMENETPPARIWSADIFSMEMLSKSWWRADHTWLAIAPNCTLVGSVTLALREGAATTVPVVHWLLVDPNWRRQGIARLLMSRLELAAWNAGWPAVELETHAGWISAVAFYQSIGYAPVRERSPR